ncbi:MAG: hypothetical protein ACRD5Z_03490, partial [Bryobacteraceae bacterium]
SGRRTERSRLGAPLLRAWAEPFRGGSEAVVLARELSALPKKAVIFCQRLFFAGALDAARLPRPSDRRRDPPPRRGRREVLPGD